MHSVFDKDQVNSVRETKQNVVIFLNICLLQQTFLATKLKLVEFCQTMFAETIHKLVDEGSVIKH